jgi:hypothetical protein
VKTNNQETPARAVLPNGTQTWMLNGLLHREDGPAVISPSGYQAWYLHDQLHREDGPAVVFPNGSRFWYLNGMELDEQEITVIVNHKLLFGDGL